MSIFKDKIASQVELGRMRAAVEASGDIAYEWDLASDHITWFGNPSQVIGIESGNMPTTGEQLHGLINPEDLAGRLRSLSDHFATGAAVMGQSGSQSVPAPLYDCEYRIRSSDGLFQWFHDRGRAQLSAGGAPESLIGVMRLVTSHKNKEARLEYLANFDDLTGHYNKLRLREALEHAVAHAVRYGQTGCYMAVGIDHLGMVNTAYGFECGDGVLLEVAQRLDRCLRSTDVIGRSGSDRFGVILSSTSIEEAREAAERVLEALRGQPMEINGAQLTVTASIGLVAFPAQSKTSFDVMTKAETALLKAKSSGRDGLCLYELTEKQERDYRVSMEIGEEVKQALRDNRLVLAYQPVVNARTHEICYYESLIRLLNPDGTLVPAARFIPVVEQLGLMRTIDRYVLGLAVAELTRFSDITLAINISGLTATDRSWLRGLTSQLNGKDDVAKRLMVEITETAALQDIEESARFVSAVRDLGCQVALDDFGAGYTTFHHIKALTVDVVKIDGSFIRDITNSRENQAFVKNLLSLAKALQLTTVAEGVETREVADFLSKMGVDHLQGYYFGKPEIQASWHRAKPAASLLESQKGKRA
ncbi:MAG: EAL domain-containing protein [Pseudomonadota bacterium]